MGGLSSSQRSFTALLQVGVGVGRRRRRSSRRCTYRNNWQTISGFHSITQLDGHTHTHIPFQVLAVLSPLPRTHFILGIYFVTL